MFHHQPYQKQVWSEWSMSKWGQFSLNNPFNLKREIANIFKNEKLSIMVLQLYFCPELLQLSVHVTCLDQIHLFLQFPEWTENIYHASDRNRQWEDKELGGVDLPVFLLCVFDQPLKLLDPLCCQSADDHILDGLHHLPLLTPLTSASNLSS